MTKKLIVITGGGSGVGLATVDLFTSIGHPCLVLGRNAESSPAAHHPNTLCRNVDVSDAQAFQQAVREAEKRYGSVDCLINNAGVMYLSTIDDQPSNQWRAMFSTNVEGVINGIQSVASTMKREKSGTIINIGSLGGNKTLDNHGLYCATKAAVHSIGDLLRQELSVFGVRVSTIAPGAIDTDLINHTTNESMVAGHNHYVSSINGALSADDIAELALYIYQLPKHICLREVVVAATLQKI
ncbi:SDR family oxidoreductase [uncultured Vibrio sp.]|uniref:SDR family oxidoreductase n=1 Tax=uncultured Vibrio sp. TaxID=114054 RepID=UPI0025FB786B|nr:SDR family oxidoreductase [uncultured Vibrio sp.]